MVKGGALSPNAFFHHFKYLGNTKGERDTPMTEADVASIQSNSVVIWVFGAVSYSDIFGAHHWTKFCVRFSPGLQPRTVVCEQHNDVGDYEGPRDN